MSTDSKITYLIRLQARLRAAATASDHPPTIGLMHEAADALAELTQVYLDGPHGDVTIDADQPAPPDGYMLEWCSASYFEPARRAYRWTIPDRGYMSSWKFPTSEIPVGEANARAREMALGEARFMAKEAPSLTPQPSSA